MWMLLISWKKTLFNKKRKKNGFAESADQKSLFLMHFYSKLRCPTENNMFFMQFLKNLFIVFTNSVAFPLGDLQITVAKANIFLL